MSTRTPGNSGRRFYYTLKCSPLAISINRIRKKSCRLRFEAIVEKWVYLLLSNYPDPFKKVNECVSFVYLKI